MLLPVSCYHYADNERLYGIKTFSSDYAKTIAANRTESLAVDTSTQFNIGSVSKIFVTMAVLKLCQDGKLELDQPVATYLPEFTMTDPRYQQITVRMLLNHTSELDGTYSI